MLVKMRSERLLKDLSKVSLSKGMEVMRYCYIFSDELRISGLIALDKWLSRRMAHLHILPLIPRVSLSCPLCIVRVWKPLLQFSLKKSSWRLIRRKHIFSLLKYVCFRKLHSNILIKILVIQKDIFSVLSCAAGDRILHTRRCKHHSVHIISFWRI